MKIITASDKLTKKFFRFIEDLSGHSYGTFMRALERKYPYYVSYSHNMPSGSDGTVFMEGLTASAKSSVWLYLNDSRDSEYFIPDNEENFALWFIDNFLTEE